MAATMLSSPTMEDTPVIGDQRKTLEEYAVENRQLKIAVDQLSRKVASYKEVLSPFISTILIVEC
jgi:hypothetical protein